ncbi:putative WD repeat-containing protein [Wickerhamomyces ciferrii]|uniref:WD repeat-containing protein n=1 Tax=Wickerhamomyces ciferrii (strain ATCC 14091 / BCRC 22168 / CBS 111 / JCM 3599 / NBRC 0793 / NRRL Y-1031 F-60-10) TaxID=1206466 RepID=K0KYE1_WICCF|nr:putative WD repeat-containing protein [Wickerhamomyces ciferrii]CCH46459.1 putative WD repeat-containing protein [Wickerhamomyces ciferrii]
MAPVHDLFENGGGNGGAGNVNNQVNTECIDKAYPGIDKNELTRLIIQSLSDLGYNRSSQLLKTESGLELDSPIINNFIAYIKNGEFNQAEMLIDNLNLIDSSLEVKTKIQFLIKRQRFLEHLYNDENTTIPLRILRNEMNSLSSTQDIRSLTALLMNKQSEHLQLSNGWLKNIENSREFLLNEISKFINPNEMIPKYRLFELLKQSIEYQKSMNLYQFNNNDRKISLYEDLKSDKTLFPDSIVKTLTDHKNEVWYVQFSHDGSKLVSTSADHHVNVYDVEQDFKKKFTLKGHEKQVLYASFSHDDKKLLTCSIEPKARIWNLETGELERIITLSSESRIWCGDWYPNGECFVLGSPDKEVVLYNAHTGEQLYKWGDSTNGPIINDLKISQDYKLIAATYDNNIEVWDLDSKSKLTTLDIGEKITSLTISNKNPNHLLINVSPNELQIWNWCKNLLLTKFVGHRQENYIIRSCFGFNEDVVCSGSEDGRVFIWNKEFGALLGAFDAHNGNANCVAWNPKYKSMFATCGDDFLIRIWGPSRSKKNV